MQLSANNKTHIIRFYILYVIYYGTISFLWPFFTYYLISKGLNSVTIGTINSLGIIASILGYYVLGYIADKAKSSGILIGALLPVMAFSLFLIQTSASIIVICFSFCACMFLKFPFEPIMDAWAIESNSATSRYFGVIRSGGSLGFGICVAFIGMKITNTEFGSAFYSSYVAICVLFLYILYLSKKVGITRTENAKNTDSGRQIGISDIKSLFKNKEYVTLLILCVCFGVPASIIKVYTPFLFTHLGGGVGEHSKLLAISALAEIPFFWASPFLLKKYNTLTLMAYSSLFLIASTLIYLLAPSAKYLIGAGLLLTVQFSVFNPAIRYGVSRIAPANLKTTAQVVMASAYGGISLCLGSFLGGFMIKIFDVKLTFFIAFIGLCLAVITMFLRLSYSNKIKINH